MSLKFELTIHALELGLAVEEVDTPYYARAQIPVCAWSLLKVRGNMIPIFEEARSEDTCTSRIHRRNGGAMKLRIYIKQLYISEVVMRVAKWGNSLAIRLPRSVVEVLGLKEGDSIEIHVADRRSFAIEKAPTSKQLLERLRKYRGRLPAGFNSIA